ncbi:histidine phosphatase family protein [SAR86 cluster bacterium]|jgi:phosphohistidine phosphatase|nr:histidine phosphatase family protein [SAR86 cluster bacterium]
MNIVLTRHAKSSWDNLNLTDHDRPLNRRGREDAKLVAKYLATYEYTYKTILCSTSKRTSETLEIFLNYIHKVDQVNYLSYLYHASAETIRKEIMTLDTGGTYMLLGHNPGIEVFLRNLNNDSSLKAPTCSIALLSTVNNSLQFNKLITPKNLKSQQNSLQCHTNVI